MGENSRSQQRVLSSALAAARRVNRVQLAALSGSDAPGRSQLSSQGHCGVETLAIAEVRCFIAEEKFVTAIAPGRQLLLQ